MDCSNKTGDIRAFFMLLGAVIKGRYRAPWAMFFWIALFLVYFISPIDLLPDYVLPGLGFADDAALLVFTAQRVRKEIKKFKTEFLKIPLTQDNREEKDL